jgi:hypothetical protein
MPLFNTEVAIADVLGLQTALDLKSATNHQHSPTAWQNLTLSTGWSNYGAEYNFATAQCRLIGNLVEVKGIIRKSGALNNTELITVLPVGYRPNQTIRIVTWGGAGTSQLQIVANGNLTLLNANNALCWS